MGFPSERNSVRNEESETYINTLRNEKSYINTPLQVPYLYILIALSSILIYFFEVTFRIFHVLTVGQNAAKMISKIFKNSILQYSDFYLIFGALSEKNNSILNFQNDGAQAYSRGALWALFPKWTKMGSIRLLNKKNAQLKIQSVRIRKLKCTRFANKNRQNAPNPRPPAHWSDAMAIRYGDNEVARVPCAHVSIESHCSLSFSRGANFFHFSRRFLPLVFLS